MKCVSIAVLGWAFFSGAPDFLSLSVVTLGFGLNAFSAMKLGSDRSYYGYEVGRLPYQRITSFPYSMTAHPMLIGNIVGFSGTLINSDFRENWLPLAVAHVSMNVGLLIMETTISADSRFVRYIRATSAAALYVICIAFVALSAGIGYALGEALDPAIGALVGIIVSAYALALFSLYSINERENAAHQTIADGKVT
jgi:protein-S-isoprenylcysteine O-methyltransferase Ste14